MKVLLVQHGSQNVEVPPLGLGYVGAALMQSNHNVQFIHLSFTSKPAKELDRAIRSFDPEVLGFTLMTPAYGEFIDIIEQSQAARDRTIIAGGPHASIESENVLRDGFVDIVARFEGEKLAPHLFNAIQNGNDLSSVNGIAYLNKEGAYIETPPAIYIEDLDALPPLPYNGLQLNKYRYRVHGIPSAIIFTSRGCPFKCVFCYRGPAAGKKVRYMSTSRVIQEIVQLHDEYGFRAFRFYDDIFTLHKNRVIELCHRILDLKFKIHWKCSTRVNCIDEELLLHMKRAGCVGIHFGVESGNADILEKLQKGITKAQARSAISLCRKLGIGTVVYFYLGTPWDTGETVQETINFAKELQGTVTTFFVATPYPGTALRKVFIEKGLYVPENAHEYHHHIEGSYHQLKNDSTIHNASDKAYQGFRKVRELCINATKVVQKNQALAILQYPKLIREYYHLYGVFDFVHRIFKRLSFLNK